LWRGKKREQGKTNAGILQCVQDDDLEELRANSKTDDARIVKSLKVVKGSGAEDKSQVLVSLVVMSVVEGVLLVIGQLLFWKGSKELRRERA
jgi:hypothetical protein